MDLVNVDRYNYDKTRFNEPGLGYALRGDLPLPTKILLHTTNNPAVYTSFHGAASFIATSRKIAADYLVGQHRGQLVRFLDPAKHISWGAGTTISTWDNPHVINIELHIDTPKGSTVKDWMRQRTPEMMEQLNGLILELCQVHPIGDLRTHVRTHRAVAVPVGRKVDPSGWSNVDIATWRALLQARRVVLLGR